MADAHVWRRAKFASAPAREAKLSRSFFPIVPPTACIPGKSPWPKSRVDSGERNSLNTKPSLKLTPILVKVTHKIHSLLISDIPLNGFGKII
jgi:hypothetical protein